MVRFLKKYLNFILFLLMIAASYKIPNLFMECIGLNSRISLSNRDAYINIIILHFSVVFLTTSLMASLGEKDGWIYYKDIVKEKLLTPNWFSFFDLSTYGYLSLVGSVGGFLLKRTVIICVSMTLGIIAVICLFNKMVSIYFRRNSIKKNVEKKIIFGDCYKNINEIKMLLKISEKEIKENEYDKAYENFNLILATMFYNKDKANNIYIKNAYDYFHGLLLNNCPEKLIQFYIDSYSENEKLFCSNRNFDFDNYRKYIEEEIHSTLTLEQYKYKKTLSYGQYLEDKKKRLQKIIQEFTISTKCDNLDESKEKYLKVENEIKSILEYSLLTPNTSLESVLNILFLYERRYYDAGSFKKEKLVKYINTYITWCPSVIYNISQYIFDIEDEKSEASFLCVEKAIRNNSQDGEGYILFFWKNYINGYINLIINILKEKKATNKYIKKAGIHFAIICNEFYDDLKYSMIYTDEDYIQYKSMFSHSELMDMVSKFFQHICKLPNAFLLIFLSQITDLVKNEICEFMNSIYEDSEGIDNEQIKRLEDEQMFIKYEKNEKDRINKILINGKYPMPLKIEKNKIKLEESINKRKKIIEYRKRLMTIFMPIYDKCEYDSGNYELEIVSKLNEILSVLD